ncbi:hypothetical protein ACVWWO_003651 [Bradyrhizobium sp. F1.13.1]
MWSSDKRDEVERDEFFKAAIQSALEKPKLRLEEINDAVAEFLRQYDWVIALYPSPDHPSGLVAIEIRNTQKSEGFSRCNSIPCESKEAALKLHDLSRGADNHARGPSVVLNRAH